MTLGLFGNSVNGKGSMSVKELIFDVRMWSKILWLDNLVAKIRFVFDFFFLFVFFGFFILTSLGWALNFVLGIWGDLYFTIFWPCLIHFDLCCADLPFSLICKFCDLCLILIWSLFYSIQDVMALLYFVQVFQFSCILICIASPFKDIQHAVLEL